MKLLKKFFAAMFAVTIGVVFFLQDSAEAKNTYSISCTNSAYGVQLGGEYITHSYVKVQSSDGVYQDAIDWTNHGNYVGRDCLYSGAAKTNGTAVVAGDVARNAINSIIGSVAGRINAAYSASETGSGTGLTFSNNTRGVGMAANRIFGGISIWGDYGSSDFENIQSFVNVQSDTNRYDGDSNSWSLGVDKNFGKLLVGFVMSNYDADLTTEFNDGTYKQDIETYGAYIAYRTNMLTVDIGIGTGDSDINTERRDLGNDKTITGTTTGEVNYTSARVQMNIERGRFTITPRIAHKGIDIDVDAFTETVPADTTGSAIFYTSNETLTTDNVAVAGRTVSSTITEGGINISGSLGSFVPFIDIAYQNESTTSPVYESEVTADSATELSASSHSGSWIFGGGINFALGSKLTGGISVGSVSGRDEYNETFASGGLSLRF